MSYIVTPFGVTSKGLEAPVKVHFVHLYPAIATRHSDSMDAVFLVGGQKVTVAISCATLAELQKRDGKNLTDQQLADIAALHLRQTLERGNAVTEAELFLSGDAFQAVGRELGYL
jgi:hypothetical protein